MIWWVEESHIAGAVFLFWLLLLALIDIVRVIHFIISFIIFSLGHLCFRWLFIFASTFDSQGASGQRGGVGVGGTRFIMYSISGKSGRSKDGWGGARYALREWCA